MALKAWHAERAFSLIEAAVVVVIIGLLAGGILAGRDMMHASELRSITADLNRFQTAMGAFQEKYTQLPGDLSNANAYWPGVTANGNGNGSLEPASTAGGTAEIFQFWNQLALSGLNGGNYSGLSGTAGAGLRAAVTGVNVPVSKRDNIGYSIENWGVIPDNSNPIVWQGIYNHTFFIGSACGDCPTEGPAFHPSDAQSIDSKMDDGRPASGKMRTYRQSYGSFSSCTTTDVAGTTGYNVTLAGDTPACNLLFITGY